MTLAFIYIYLPIISIILLAKVEEIPSKVWLAEKLSLHLWRIGKSSPFITFGKI